MRTVILGGAFNPVTPATLVMCDALLNSGLFEQVILQPCGTRKDKPHLVETTHRRHLLELAIPEHFSHHPKCRFDIDYSYIDKRNTPTYKVIADWKKDHPNDELFWCIGGDLVVPDKTGQCEIQRDWVRGVKLYQDCNFVVFPRPGYTHPSKLYLPSNFLVIDVVTPHISSTQIRELISTGAEWEHYYTNMPQVPHYIKQFSLFGWRE